MKLRLVIIVITLAFASLGQAAENCDFGGLQTALRNAADSLHDGNPVRYIDFADDAPFSAALDRMQAVGVPAGDVQMAWVAALQELCGPKAGGLSIDDVGPMQTLSGLSNLLQVNPE